MSHSRRRFRKTAILTTQGLQKLEVAKSTQAYTLEALSERTGLSTHTLSKIHSGQSRVDLRSLVRYFTAFNLTLEAEDYVRPFSQSLSNPPNSDTEAKHICSEESLLSTPYVSWGLAPNLSQFYGRATELATLKQWILDDRCRLITLLGMQGIGKTYLAIKLVEQIQSKFQVVIWRSLHPPGRSHLPLSFNDYLDDIISHLTPNYTPSISESNTVKVRQLITRLSQIPCLLILDAAESVFQPSILPASANPPLMEQYHSTTEGYSYFIKHVGRARHQSCVILTSRVEPQLFRSISDNASSTRSLSLQGLSVADIQQMFAARGDFQATPENWERFVKYYDGNPLLLGVLSKTIQHLFNSNITNFLEIKTPIFGSIREVLDHQFKYLSVIEKEVVKTLAAHKAPLSFSELRLQVPTVIPCAILLESVNALKRRSLIDRDTTQFALPLFLQDYIYDNLS
jgi:transcriptional regulator with XRE-family HTH domain